MITFYSILLAILGFTLYSGGIVLQKKGVSWMSWEGEKDRKFYLNLLIWGFGMLMSFILSVFPNGAASKNLPPHIVSAMSGWGIVVVVMLSYFLLKEKLYISDVLYSLLIVVSIFVIGIAQKTASFAGVNIKVLNLLLFIPFILLCLGFVKSLSPKIRAVLYASFAGIGDGLTIVLLAFGVREMGTSVMAYIRSPYLYIYALMGICTAVSLQFAYRLGEMVLIAPLQISFSIIYPMICSYFVFGVPINFIQAGAIAFIIFSCLMILRKH
jgi:hypothetical protein